MRKEMKWKVCICAVCGDGVAGFVSVPGGKSEVV